MKAPMSFTRCAALSLAALAMALGFGSAAHAQQYFIEELGTLGGPLSAAFGLNNFGVVTGFSALEEANYHGFLYDGGLTDIPPLAAHLQSHSFAINASEQVATVSYDLGDMHLHGLLWQDGVATTLGSLAPRGLNDAGTVVGFVSLMEPSFGWVDHAALWQSGTLFDLGTLGGQFSYGYAVDSADRVAGISFTTNDAAPRAALWQSGTWHELGTLGGATSAAYAMNEFGEIVGVADTAAGEPHACLFAVDAGGNVLTRTDLGVLGGGYSYAYAVNESGDVVGTSDDRAFLRQNGAIEDLNGLIAQPSDWELRTAWAINDEGWIAGAGLHLGQPRAFLLRTFLLGDLNCDGAVNNGDIAAFVLAITDPTAYAQKYPDCDALLVGDINGDDQVNNGDIPGFIALLTDNRP